MKKKAVKKKGSKNLSLWSKIKGLWGDLVGHVKDHILCLDGFSHIAYGVLGCGLALGCVSLELALGLGLIWHSVRNILHK